MRCLVAPTLLLSAIVGLCGLAVQAVSTASNQASPVPESELAHVKTEIGRIEQAMPKLADRGAALFLLAKEYVRIGDSSKALSLLKECIALDEGFDPGDSPTLAPLRSAPEFPRLVAEVRRRHPAVHNARVAFTFPEKDLFPEGLAVDPEKHIFYMGSMHRKKIVMRDDKGNVSDFVKPDVYHLLGLGGIKIDTDHMVWAASDNGRDSELLHFDTHGKLVERYSPPGPGPHVLNDLVLRGPGEIYVTDTAADKVYRFDRQVHSFTPLALPRPLFGPNGIALTPDENLLYIADLMGVIQVDLRSNTAVDVSPGEHNTLAGNDGLYFYQGSLLGLQYGAGSFRAMRWRLSADGRRVASAEVLEYRSRLISFPTTGTVYEGKFYFIANTGIGNLDDDRIIDPAKLEPVHIAVVPLH